MRLSIPYWRAASRTSEAAGHLSVGALPADFVRELPLAYPSSSALAQADPDGALVHRQNCWVPPHPCWSREEATDPARVPSRFPTRSQGVPHVRSVHFQEEGFANLSNNRDYNQPVKRVNAIRMPPAALSCLLLHTSSDCCDYFVQHYFFPYSFAAALGFLF
jgi:hypothetical protein